MSLKFDRFICAKKNKNLHYLFFYSDALQSLNNNITFYLLQTLNGDGYRGLGNDKQMQSTLLFFCFEYFLFDKLEKNFLLYVTLSVHTCITSI